MFEEFEVAILAFEIEKVEAVKLRCVDPAPPVTLIKVVITWDD